MAIAVSVFGLSCRGDVGIDVRPVEQEAAPGQFVTPVFALTTSELDPVTVSLTLIAPAGWQILEVQESIIVSPEEEEAVFVTVIVPSDAAAGAYELTLIAASETDPTDRTSGTAGIVVSPINEIELLGPGGTSAAPGGAVEYEFTLVNRGNAQDSVIVDAVSSRGLPVSLSASVFDLAPQERATIVARIDVPTGSDSGQDVLTVTATSSLYGNVGDDAVVFTTILPPTPDVVGGSLMEILPGRLRLSIDRDVFDGTFDSRLTFSTSGRVVDGYFSSFLSVNDPLGPDPIDVTLYTILYRRDPAVVMLGNVSKRLSDLVGLTCEGGSFEIDDELLDLTLVAGLSGDEARFGGQFAMGPEVANVGFTFFDARSPTSRRAIGGATAEAEPLEDWRIFAEAALGTNDGLTSRAFLFGTEIDTAGYFLNGEAFSIGTGFPGSGTDSAGIRLSQRLRMPDLSLSLSLTHEWNNVVRDPLESTQVDDGLGFNLSATPIEDGPKLSSTVEFEWSRLDDPALMSDVYLLISMGIRETSGVFPYTFSGEIEDRIDLAFGDHTRTLTFTEGVGLSVDSFYLYLQLEQEKSIDVLTDLVLAGETEVSILFRPEGTLHEGSIRLQNTGDAFDLSVSLDIRFTDWLDITFDGSIAWDRGDADPISFGWGITFNADLQIPLPFLVTKGRIEGRLFVDTDGDGVFGTVDRPIAGGILAANGTEVSTDQTGLFRFPPLGAGDYTLAVRAVPSDASSAERLDVHVAPGQTTRVKIPLQPILSVEGIVFEDANQDGSRAADEGGFADVRVLFTRDDGPTRAAVTDTFGRFALADVDPGSYTVSLDPATLPGRFVFTTEQTITIDLDAAADGRTEFGGYIRPREVIITFQPPTADFTFTPSEPTAGETVTFDGTPSFDFDGEIVSYAWDFDGDSTFDATDPIVEWTFASPGDASVGLTVTDESGNQDTLVRTVPVAEGAPAAEPAASSFQPPIADFSFAPESPKTGESVTFDGTLSFDFDGQIASYAWDFDDDDVSDAAGPTATQSFSATGAYPVRLTVTDDGGNTDTVAKSVEVLERPTESVDVRPTLVRPTADFSYTPGRPIVGEPVTFDASPSSDPDGEIVSFAWDFDGDGSTDAAEPIVEYPFPSVGSYSVRLTVTDDSGISDTVLYVIQIDSPSFENGDETILPPIASFAFSPEAPFAGEPVEFNGMLSFDFDGTILAYAWDFDSNGVIDATGPIVLHVFPSAGDYAVRLTVTDDDGATDTVVRTLTVE